MALSTSSTRVLKTHLFLHLTALNSTKNYVETEKNDLFFPCVVLSDIYSVYIPLVFVKCKCINLYTL